MLEIPVQTHPHYTEEIELEGQPYIFEFSWNTRETAWYMDILTSEEEPVVLGIKLVVNYELIRMYASPLLPPGGMIVFDTEKSPGERVTQDDFGTRFKLLYMTKDEINAL